MSNEKNDIEIKQDTKDTSFKDITEELKKINEIISILFSISYKIGLPLGFLIIFQYFYNLGYYPAALNSGDIFSIFVILFSFIIFYTLLFIIFSLPLMSYYLYLEFKKELNFEKTPSWTKKKSRYLNKAIHYILFFLILWSLYIAYITNNYNIFIFFVILLVCAYVIKSLLKQKKSIKNIHLIVASIFFVVPLIFGGSITIEATMRWIHIRLDDNKSIEVFVKKGIYKDIICEYKHAKCNTITKNTEELTLIKNATVLMRGIGSETFIEYGQGAKIAIPNDQIYINFLGEDKDKDKCKKIIEKNGVKYDFINIKINIKDKILSKNTEYKINANGATNITCTYKHEDKTLEIPLKITKPIFCKTQQEPFAAYCQ